MKKDQADEKPSKVMVVRTSTLFWAVILFTLINFLLLFLLSTHIVTESPTIAVEYIPKEHLTFKDTFVSVDGYMKRYNDASSREKRRLRNTDFHQALVEKRLINPRD